MIMIAVAMATLTACGGKSAGEGESMDSNPADTVAATDSVAVEIADALLTSGGIAPIEVGMKVIDIQPSVEGLYDSIVSENGYESNSYYFFLNGEQRFTAYEFDPGVVNLVCADNGSIYVNGDEDTRLRMGDPFGKVLGLKNVEAVWQEGDGEGVWSWKCNGIWYLPDQSALTEKLSQKLYNSDSAPKGSDFDDSVTIGYMGTGLPW